MFDILKILIHLLHCSRPNILEVDLEEVGMGWIELMGGRGMWPLGRKWEQVMGLLHNSMLSLQN